MILDSYRKIGVRGNSLIVTLPAGWHKFKRLKKGGLLRVVSTDDATVIIKRGDDEERILRKLRIRR